MQLGSGPFDSAKESREALWVFESLIKSGIFDRRATFQLPCGGVGAQFVKPLLGPLAILLLEITSELACGNA